MSSREALGLLWFAEGSHLRSAGNEAATGSALIPITSPWPRVWGFHTELIDCVPSIPRSTDAAPQVIDQFPADFRTRSVVRGCAPIEDEVMSSSTVRAPSSPPGRTARQLAARQLSRI